MISGVILLGSLSIILLRLSYTDLKEKIIEVPIALYATGLVTAFFLIERLWIELVLFTILFFLLNLILKPLCENKKFIGAGDISVLSFLIPAAWLVNPYFIPIFLFSFALFSLVFYFKELKTNTEKPMLPIMTIAWLVTWIIIQFLIKGGIIVA